MANTYKIIKIDTLIKLKKNLILSIIKKNSPLFIKNISEQWFKSMILNCYHFTFTYLEIQTILTELHCAEYRQYKALLCLVEWQKLVSVLYIFILYKRPANVKFFKISWITPTLPKIDYMYC